MPINNKKTLLAILARKGSKRIKNKNIKRFNGKPLVVWTIEQALRFDNSNIQVLLSSDCEETLKISQKYKKILTLKRPKRLANSNTTAVEVLKHLINTLKFSGHIILLQPTSPLRLDQDIKKVLSFLKKIKSPIISVSKFVHDSSLITKANKKQKFMPLSNQKYNLYYPNGAIFAAHSEWLKINSSFYDKKTFLYIMPEERSIDIDYEYQFIMAEALIKRRLMVDNSEL